MKTKITLLAICSMMVTAAALAGTNPSSTAKASSAANKTNDLNQSRNSHGVAIAAMTECGTAVTFSDGLPIVDNDTSGTSALITVSGITGSNLGADVFLTKVHIAGHHSFVGDLIFSLTAPNGTSVLLMNRPGRTTTGFGCQYDNFSFDVVNGTGHDNESTCIVTPTAPVPPDTFAIEGVFSTFGTSNLNSINLAGGDPNAIWTLFASDNAAQDTGSIDTLIMYFTGPSSVFSYVISSTTVNVTATPGTGVTYGWDFGDGNYGTGSTASNTYAVGGNYLITMARATITDTCIMSVYVNPAIGVGIPVVNAHTANLIIAPNPSSGKVDINISEISSGNADLVICDYLGRIQEVEHINSVTYHKSIDASQWSKGIYFVKVVNKDFTKVQKLVLK